MSEAVAGDQPAEVSGGFIGSLPAILWQRRWLIILPAVLIAVAATAAAFLLPRVYRSSATLLVESQDLPGENANAEDDPIDRRIAKIRQQILARPDLVDLIQTNNLYDAASRTQPLSKLVDQMRDDTKLAAVDADIQRGAAGRNTGSIAFQLSFDYARPAQAQLVAQTFVDRLLKLDAASTQTAAETNVNVLQDQETSLKSQVDAIQAQITRITGVNGAALSSANAGMIGTGGNIDYASQIATLQRENAALKAQTGLAVERDSNVNAAEAQLAAVKAIYADDHPDVKLAESRLAAARANAKSYQARGVSALVQQQLDANNTAISRLTAAMETEHARAAALAAAQSRGPAVAQQVTQLQQNAEGIRANLSRVQSQLLNARSASRMVEEQRGERLLLIDPPVMPDSPISPNRPLLLIGGLAGGLAIGLALALLAEGVLRPIRTVGQITNLTGVPPLGVVPVVAARGRKPGRAKRRRRWFGRRRKAEDAVADYVDE